MSIGQKLNPNLFVKVFLLVAVTIIYMVPLSHLEPLDITYSYHIKLAEKMVQEEVIPTPHFLYQALVGGIHLLMPFVSYQVAGFYIVPLIAAASLGLVLQHWIQKTVVSFPSLNRLLCSAILAIALLLVTCVSLFTYPRLYLGYMAMTEYHSATTLLAKPLSFLLFVSVATMLLQKGSTSWRSIFYTAIVSALGLLAKPSYIICLLPATFILIGYRLIKRQTVCLIPIILGFVLPAFVVLSWQYHFSYVSDQTNIIRDYGESSIAFAPLKVMSLHSKYRFFPVDEGLFSIEYTYRIENMDCNILGLSYSCDLLRDFFLSILFPLFVYIFYFKQSTKNFMLNFAWLTFLISAFYTYFLAESGNRMSSGNFLWSGQISLFILFVCTTVFLLQLDEFRGFLNTRLTSINQSNDLTDWLKKYFRSAVCALAFGLHFISGLLQYIFVSHAVIVSS